MTKKQQRTSLSQFLFILHYYSEIKDGVISIKMPHFHFEQSVKECKDEEWQYITDAFESGEKKMFDELKKFGEIQEEEYPSSWAYFSDNFINFGEKEEAYEDRKDIERWEAENESNN